MVSDAVTYVVVCYSSESAKDSDSEDDFIRQKTKARPASDSDSDSDMDPNGKRPPEQIQDVLSLQTSLLMLVSTIQNRM